MDENLWMWMKMGIERWRSTDWWSCKAGPGSMADASFCNGQYIPGSTPYPTPPEDTILSSYSLCHHIFVIGNIFQGAPPILLLHKIQLYLHILSVITFYKGQIWFQFAQLPVTLIEYGCIWLNMRGFRCLSLKVDTFNYPSYFPLIQDPAYMLCI